MRFFNDPLFYDPMALAIITAFGGAVWPILARASGVSQGAILVSVSLAPIVIGYMLKVDLAFSSSLSRWYFLTAVVIAAANGFFYTRLATLPNHEMSRSLPINAACFPVFVLLGSWLILGEAVWDARKLLGVGAAITAIFLLRP